MHARVAGVLAQLMVWTMPLLAQTPTNVPGAPSGTPIPIPAAQIKWTNLDSIGAPGVKVADIWGDHTKGAFGAFFRLPAGFAAPLHTHTHDMKVVIISGTYIRQPEGKAVFQLGTGSHLMQPGGNYRHTTSCALGADCVFYAESDGPFDLLPVVTSPPKSK